MNKYRIINNSEEKLNKGEVCFVAIENTDERERFFVDLFERIGDDPDNKVLWWYQLDNSPIIMNYAIETGRAVHIHLVETEKGFQLSPSSESLKKANLNKQRRPYRVPGCTIDFILDGSKKIMKYRPFDYMLVDCTGLWGRPEYNNLDEEFVQNMEQFAMKFDISIVAAVYP